MFLIILISIAILFLAKSSALILIIGLLLGFAASPPLAEKNGFAPFHYVERQIVFGALSLSTMIIMSMMSVNLVRRLAVIGFIFSV